MPTTLYYHQIDKLKKQLEVVTKDHSYNFRHPAVLSISQELDKVIVSAMKEGLSYRN